MKILVESSENLKTVKDYFNFNQVETLDQTTWDHDTNLYDINSTSAELTILDSDIFLDIVSNTNSFDNLVSYCCSGRVLWIFNDLDSLLAVPIQEPHLRLLDLKIPFGSMTWFVDGHVDYSHVQPFKNINLVSWFPNHIVGKQMTRIESGKIKKIKCANNFLLTTVLRKHRPHRIALYEQFKKHNLLDQGVVIFNQESSPGVDEFEWIGTTPATHHRFTDHASMDLYLNCWFEVAPETMHQPGMFFLTEKTIKPIVTETPFLTMSSPYYLKYLRSLGFKTFGNLIDESYDQEFDLIKRAEKVACTVQDIVRNGSESFYHAASDILTHNRYMMYQLHGAWHAETDALISQTLESTEKYLKSSI